MLKQSSDPPAVVTPTYSSAVQELIQANIGFAHRQATKFKRRLPRCVDGQDLQSDAYLGLIEAAHGFDSQRGCPFRAFAARRIRGAMLDGIRLRNRIRRHHAPPVFHSLSSLVDLGGGIKLPLEQMLLANQPPVGQRMELLDEAEQVLKELSPSERRALKDVHLLGYQQKQIAQRLGISQSAISQRMRRIRGRVEQILAHLAQDN